MSKKIVLIAVFVCLTSSVSGYASTKESVRTGMALSDAMKIAIDCVKEAAGFKAISDRRRIRLYRSEDKLDFLGITDMPRLSALRRYLVRNEEIGVQSIWREEVISEGRSKFHRFMISRNHLADLKTDWTLLKLAQRIADKAGTAQLPESSANKIVADCVAYPNDEEPIDLPSSPVTVSVPMTTRIESMVTDPTKFSKCVVQSRKFGIESVVLMRPEDEESRYFLSVRYANSVNSESERFIRESIAKGWTFRCLAGFLKANSQVAFAKRSTAAGVSLSALDSLINANTVYTKKSKLGLILPKGNLDLLKQQIIYNLDPGEFVIPSGCTDGVNLGPKQIPFLGGNPGERVEATKASFFPGTGGGFDLSEVTKGSTVEDLIDEVYRQILRIIP